MDAKRLRAIVISIVGLAIIIAASYFGVEQVQEKKFGADIGITIFTQNSLRAGKGMVRIPFVRGRGELVFTSVAVDADQDGIYQGDEWIIENRPLYARKDSFVHLYFSNIASRIESPVKVRVAGGDKKLPDDVFAGGVVNDTDVEEKLVIITIDEIDNLFDFDLSADSWGVAG